MNKLKNLCVNLAYDAIGKSGIRQWFDACWSILMAITALFIVGGTGYMVYRDPITLETETGFILFELGIAAIAIFAVVLTNKDRLKDRKNNSIK